MRRWAGAVLALAAPGAGFAQGDFRMDRGADSALVCPDRLAEFVLAGRTGAECRYEGARESRARLIAGPPPAPPEGGAALFALENGPEGWAGTVFHLGEGADGDGRREHWRAEGEARPLSAVLDYVIPRVSPAEMRLFLEDAGAANGMERPDPESDVEDCAGEIAGFALEQRVTSREAGAAVLSGCVYVQDGMSAMIYTPRAADQALAAFEAQLDDGFVDLDGAPEAAGTRARVVIGDALRRGFWLREARGGLTVVEADWEDPEDAARVQALLDAVFGR